jgi:hypothetical protein
MINFEIVFSVCLGIFLYRILMAVFLGVVKGLFPNRWQQSKNDYK